MATVDKSKTQTYDFLSKNKSIEDIKQQPNIEVIEKRRHGGKTFKIIEKNIANNHLINDNLSENNRENLEQVTSNLTNEVKEQETNNDIWTKLKYYLNLSTPSSNTEEIQKLNHEIKQLKNEIEKLKQSKQNDINLTKYSYNAVTIYDEKQKPKIIKKIHEEILPINNQIYFITTIQNLDKSINEEVMHFQQFQNGDIEIMKQLKKYENLNEYKKNILLIDKISTNDTNNYQFVPINNFLKQQQDFKLKPTKSEIIIWTITILIPIVLITIGLIHPPLFIIGLGLGITGLGLKGIASILSPTTKKVESWIKIKLNKNKEQKEKNKKERQSIIKNLANNDLETRLQTQYDILKQELDNRKNKNPDKLISNNKINHNSNSTIQNSIIESENNQNFDSSIRNKVNQQHQHSTISKNNWDKVKCLLTT